MPSCSSYIKEHKNAKYLPLIYPVVLYNGLQKYKVPLSFWDLFEEKDKAKRAWMENYQLVNVHDIPDNVFIKMGWSGALEYAMKYYYEKDKIEIMRKAGKLGIIPALLEAGDKGLEFLSNLSTYLLNDLEEDDSKKMIV